MSTNLNLRIISDLSDSQQVLAYLETKIINVKNFETAAVVNKHMAPGSTYRTYLPTEILVGASGTDTKGTIETKLLPASYNDSFEIYDNREALDIHKTTWKATENTIDICNNYSHSQYAYAYKDGNPMFRCHVRPGSKVNFRIEPTIYFAVCEEVIHDKFFDAAVLSQKPFSITYEGHEFLTVHVVEKSERIEFEYSFERFVV